MLPLPRLLQTVSTFIFGMAAWLAAERTASAQVVFAQTGTAKTAVGWTLVLLCIALGLIVVCRPNRRKPVDKN
jgi:hypothetical protein